VANALQPVGIRLKVRSLERAAFITAHQEKKLKNLFRQASGAPGNAATRVEVFVHSKGMFAYGRYADIDGLFEEQATMQDPKRRAATLQKIQQLMHERIMHIPLFESAFLSGVGPKVAESGLGLIPNHLYSAPYEDLALKK
jgi:peptide/nickel transport system substrate-binding protein